MKFTVTMEKDEDGFWFVQCPAIPGCVSQGETEAEALKNISEVIAIFAEMSAKEGKPLRH
ncbi:hypothetical protein BH09SUM1_BH09SUM1_24010 [soil metagenome]